MVVLLMGHFGPALRHRFGAIHPAIWPMVLPMKWGFVINRLSGGGKPGSSWQQLQSHWPKERICDIAESPFEVWYERLAQPLAGLVTAGGDGTIHWLSHAMRDWSHRPMLLPWPMGTGNDCAKFLNWPRRK